MALNRLCPACTCEARWFRDDSVFKSRLSSLLTGFSWAAAASTKHPFLGLTLLSFSREGGGGGGSRQTGSHSVVEFFFLKGECCGGEGKGDTAVQWWVGGVYGSQTGQDNQSKKYFFGNLFFFWSSCSWRRRIVRSFWTTSVEVKPKVRGGGGGVG